MVHKTSDRNRRGLWIAAILVSAAPAASAQHDSVLDRALHYFTRHDADEVLKLFDSARPAPVSDSERGRILATLPTEGHVRALDAAQQKKQIRTDRLVSGIAPFRSDIATSIVGFSGVGISFDGEASTDLPVSLLIPKGLRPVVENMWRTSPAFRRQCARLTETAVPITVFIGLPSGIPAVRAFTRIERRHGSVKYAHVYLDARLVRAHEDLAHEIEHVLEQVDGVDLAGLLANGVHGVRTYGERSVLETARAAAVGRLVSSEVSHWRRQVASGPATGAAATSAPPSAGG